jgi:hypothetical protein
MLKMNAQLSNYRRQTGIALITSLIIMMVLTILGVTAMNMTSLEEKMAFNTQDRYLARYLAESSMVLVADQDLLPPPDEAGVIIAEFELDSSDINKLDTAAVQITYMQEGSYSNMPKTNPVAQRLSSGSGDDNPYMYQIFARANTNAGTTAQMRAGYYYAPPNRD